MLAAVDVYYWDEEAQAACVLFREWSDEQPAGELTRRVAGPAAYRPGELYLRELPPILTVLADAPAPPACVVVDAHVWLGPSRPGLGARLFAALDERVPVIGVAKSPFRGSPALELLRGRSTRPLFVSAAGLPPELALARVRSMHGPYRIPTLLARADRLSRGLDLP